MKLTKYISIGLIALLSACTVGKKYSRPDVSMPEHFRNSISTTADSVQLPWRTFFKEPQLVGLIEKALSKNNDVSVAVLTIRQLDLNYQQAKLGLYPNLDFSLGANRTWLSKNSLNGSLSEQFLGTAYMDDYSATVRLSWEADIWGKAKNHKESALAEYFMQKENLSALKTRLIAQVAQAYFNLLTLDEQLSVAQKNIAFADTALTMIRLQYQSGQTSSLAVEQAEAQKKTAELLIPVAKQAISAQENALSILCGEYPTSIERTKSMQEALPTALFNEGVPANLLSRRPDVKASEYAVISANAKMNLANIAMYPSISLTPSIGANSFKLNTWFDLPGSLIKTVGVNLTQPIFNKKALQTAFEVSTIEREKAVLNFRQSLVNAVGEVSTALSRGTAAKERLELIQSKNSMLSKATKDALLLYKNGMASYLEVITTLNNSLQNELDAISVRKEQFDASTELYRSLGGGVE